MSDNKWDELEAAFKIEVNDRSEEVDPDWRHDWESLTLGWAIGKGLTPNDANEFAIHMRYRT